MIRIPKEPDNKPDDFQDATRSITSSPAVIAIPPAYKFSLERGLDLDVDVRECHEYQELYRHVLDCIALGQTLTDPSNDTLFDHVVTKKCLIKMAGDGDRLPSTLEAPIRVESIAVKGSAHTGLKGIRHIMKISGVDASYLFGVMNRISYTSAIDKYSILVKQVESLSQIRSIQEIGITYCQVVHTVDKIFPVFGALRDFATLDFASERDLMHVSRSCEHPGIPRTEAPAFFHPCCSEARTYRVPLLFYSRVIADEQDPNSCTLVQFQYSDVGGMVPIKVQNDAVVQFGLDNIPKIAAIAFEAKSKGIELGAGTEGYKRSPLEPRWEQSVHKLIPGL